MADNNNTISENNDDLNYRKTTTNNNDDDDDDDEQDQQRTWMRGVNIGGWLLAERFITPYLFAINSCHLDGDLCWYPGQIGIPKTNNVTLCNTAICTPIQPFQSTIGNADFHPRHDELINDYPKDEYSLGLTFRQHNALEIGQRYMERHWDTFLTQEDVQKLAAAGVTHVRVPLPFWIRGYRVDEVTEPYIFSKSGWKYFQRFAHWCLEANVQIWADLHGAPGSENGFDNSGHYLGHSTCEGWTNVPEHVERTVDILTDILSAIAADEFPTEAVTGFGLLNEPFLDCDTLVLRGYYQQGLKLVRNILGDDVSVFIGDSFQAWRFNDGFWADEPNTLLDSHPYHIFFEKGRAFTPRQHIAYVCRHNTQDIESCCYEDGLSSNNSNTIPTRVGMKRMVGEWSGAYDQLPTALAPMVVRYVAAHGIAPYLNRSLSDARKEFLAKFVQAQMVAYESRDRGVSKGWLFWNFKMEGGVFAEWDFLRGLEEGWIPNPLPSPETASEDIYGSCYDIYNETSDDYDLIVDEYPDPRTLDWNLYQGWDATDDFVLDDPLAPRTNYGPTNNNTTHQHVAMVGISLLAMMAILSAWYVKRNTSRKNQEVGRRKEDYEELK